MIVVNPVDNEELYESVVLAGVRSPGTVTITGHDRTIGWDVKKGPGLSGATTTRTSEDPVEFVCSFYLVKDVTQGIDDFAGWDAFAKLVMSSVAGKKPKALDIYHPVLAPNDITSVVLKKFGGQTLDGKGGGTYPITFLEYRPPKPKTGSPSGSSSKKAKPDPNADVKAQLALLTAEYQRTPWG